MKMPIALAIAAFALAAPGTAQTSAPDGSAAFGIKS